MLSRELMGVVALGVLWVNGLLVIAVALRQLGNVLRLRARIAAADKSGALVVGVVSRTSEPFALRHVQQMGRAITTRGPDRILFTDGPQSFEVRGGTVETAEGDVTVEPAPPARSEVWPAPERVREAVACPGEARFEEAFPEASKFKGYRREVDVEVRAGDRVWVLGQREGDRVRAPEDGPLIVSMVDPGDWASSRARLIVWFCAGAALSLVACTALALTEPVFGTLSTIGGALCIAWFLGIQPLGTALRDAVRVPARRPLGGLWVRPGA